jgi:hypothetical protein
LPREVLSSIPDYDPINEALLIRAQEREMGGKFAELFEAQGKLSVPELSSQERERLEARIETLKDEIAQIDPDFDFATFVALTPEERWGSVAAMREAGRKLGAKYAELMAAERNLRAVGVDIRGVRVDRFYVQGLDKKEPKLRRQIALLLFRVAVIEEEIAELNPHFQRHVPRCELTRGEVLQRIGKLMSERGVNEQEWSGANRELRPNGKPFEEQRHFPIRRGEVRSPVGKQAARVIQDRGLGHVLTAKGWQVPDELLDYGLTAEDLSDMGLPAITGRDQGQKERRKRILGKLADMGMSNADEVKLSQHMHRKIQDRIFNTRAGRNAARSAFGATTAQLSAEYLSLVFRSVTGEHDKFSLRHNDEVVKTSMIARWGEIMKLTSSEMATIARASKRIRFNRTTILRNMARLARREGNAARLEADIRRDHEDCLKAIRSIGTMLKEPRRTFVYAMIRAAVLSARPQRPVGEDRYFESIDLYDASRYRKEIFEILSSWGVDTALYEVLIDHVVFGRAEDSALAPGTVTAHKLARWKAVLEQANPFRAIPQQQEQKTAEEKSLKDRARQLPIQAAKAVGGFFSGKAFDPMDPEHVEQIVASLKAIVDGGKISLRTHTLVRAGIEVATDQEVSIPLSFDVGDQTGVIFKRVNNWLDVRLLYGGVGNGLLGIASGVSGGAASLKRGGTASASGWDTEGVELRFKIERDPVTGEEKFDKVESYVRALLTGKRLSTEQLTTASVWRGIRKSGWHVKGGTSTKSELGINADAFVGTKASAGVNLTLDENWRYRKRDGKHWNAFEEKDVHKQTYNSTGSVVVGATANLGYEHAVGANVSESLAAGITTSNIAGVSAGAYVTNVRNLARYQAGTKYGRKLDFDLLVDVGSVASAEEAFDKCGPDVAECFRPLLDKKVRLDNGVEVTFRDAIEQLLGLMQMNDGFLMQFVQRPEVEEDVDRRMRRIAQITDQILPAMEPTLADKLNPLKKRKLKEERERLLAEIAREEAFIRQAGDPANLENFIPSGVWIMPLSMQTEETTVLNVLGLLKISHVGVRMHDAMVCWVPAPKEEDRSNLEIARDGLDSLVAGQKKATSPPMPVSRGVETSPSEFGPVFDKQLDETLAFLRGRPAPASSEASISGSATDDEDVVVFETPPGSSPSSPSESSIEESPPPPSPYRERGYQRVRDRPWFGRRATSPMIFSDIQSEE